MCRGNPRFSDQNWDRSHTDASVCDSSYVYPSLSGNDFFQIFNVVWVQFEVIYSLQTGYFSIKKFEMEIENIPMLNMESSNRTQEMFHVHMVLRFLMYCKGQDHDIMENIPC